jgi:hypothetical protein
MMTPAQFAALRDTDLTMVATLLSGALLVREADGTLLELDRDGDLAAHTERAGRVDPAAIADV